MTALSPKRCQIAATSALRSSSQMTHMQEPHHLRHTRRMGSKTRIITVMKRAATRAGSAASIARSLMNGAIYANVASTSFLVSTPSHVLPIMVFARRTSSTVGFAPIRRSTDQGTEPTAANSDSSVRRTRPSGSMTSGASPKHFIGMAASLASPTGSVSRFPVLMRAT